MYYPDQPETSFLYKDENPFNLELARVKKSTILANKDWGNPVEFYREGGVVKWKKSDKPIYMDFPYKGGYHDAPFVMYVDRAYLSPTMFSYVAGWDGYKIDEMTNSSSMMTLYIVCMIGHVEQIVGSIATRPRDIFDAYEQCKLALEYYNAFCLCEREDMAGFKKHMKTFPSADHLLSREIKLDKTNRSLKYQDQFANYGQPANISQSKNYLRGLSKEHAEKNFEEVNVDGQHLGYVKGISTIPDPMLLEEYIKYKPGLNTDRKEAFQHALLLAECVRMENIMPQNDTYDNGYKKDSTPMKRNIGKSQWKRNG